MLIFHSKINPADCVDMDCDGLKKVILKDETGDLLGEGVTMISQSEWEWDGDRRRGLGDYRVPKVRYSCDTYEKGGGEITVKLSR